MTVEQFVTGPLRLWIDGHPVSKRRYKGEYRAQQGSKLLTGNLMLDTTHGVVLAVRDPERPLVLHSAEFGITDRWSNYSTVRDFNVARHGHNTGNWDPDLHQWVYPVSTTVEFSTPIYQAPANLLDLCADGVPPCPNDVERATRMEWRRLQTVITHTVKLHPKGVTTYNSSRGLQGKPAASYYSTSIATNWVTHLNTLNILRGVYGLPLLPGWVTADGTDLVTFNNLRQLAESA